MIIEKVSSLSRLFGSTEQLCVTTMAPPEMTPVCRGVLAAVVLSLMGTACEPLAAHGALAPALSPFPWWNASKPFGERIDLLVAAMNVTEKISQLVKYSPGIPRLNVPPYAWHEEAAHGTASAGVSTCFPCSIARAAAFDKVRFVSPASNPALLMGRPRVCRFPRKGATPQCLVTQGAGATVWPCLPREPRRRATTLFWRIPLVPFNSTPSR